MKRLVVMLILTTVIVGVLTYSMPRGLQAYIEDINSCATVSIYCRDTSMASTNLGCGKVVECSVADFNNVVVSCRDIDGLSVTFQGSQQDVERIAELFNLKVTSTLDIDGLLVVCGNSAKLKGGVTLDGETVNLQIAYKDGAVTVGSPLILGSY